MHRPRLSVVMPVHNGMPYVEASVRSILAQTFTDFEFVIGDDGSTDGTGEVVDRLAREDPRIRLLRHAAPSGLSVSANWVVSAANAPIVAIAHADDLSTPDRLERQMALIEASDDVVMVGAMAAGIDADGAPVHAANLWRLVFPSSQAAFSHSSVMFRRAAFDAVGGYRTPADFWEDLDLYWRLSKVGRVLISPATLSAYRYSKVSVKSRAHEDQFEMAMERMYRATDAFRRTGDHEGVLASDLGRGRIHPRIFVAKSWLAVWSGRKTDMFGSMMRNARLGFDIPSLQSVVFVAWASASPRTLRALLQAIVVVRNAFARMVLADKSFVEWHPGPVRQAAFNAD